MKETMHVEPLEPLIFSARGERVVLDADLARVYGVTTRALNQAVKRNSERFPRDFAFQLDLRTDDTNRSRIVIGSQRHRDLRIAPWVFTEKLLPLLQPPPAPRKRGIGFHTDDH